MKRLFVAFFVAFAAIVINMPDAEAARLGGGRSFGMQRQAVTPRPATPPQQAAPAPASPTPAAPAPAQAKRSWLGPIAGLAAGIGLAALFSHFGLGAELANVVMLALLAMAAVFVFRLLFRRPQQPSNDPMRYAGPGAPEASSLRPEYPAGGAAASPVASVPADFDSEGFLRVAKLNFVRLQAANDARNFDDLRDFVSPELYAEIKLQIDERGPAPQQTDVVTLEAELLEVLTEGNRHIASVRFAGLIREAAGAAAAPFAEVWHLTKPSDGSRGWTVAGIQQAG